MVSFLEIYHVKLLRICGNNDIKTHWLRDQESMFRYISHSSKMTANNKATILSVRT